MQGGFRSPAVLFPEAAASKASMQSFLAGMIRFGSMDVLLRERTSLTERRSIDISQTICADLPTWPGDTRFTSEPTWTDAAGCPVNVSRHTASTHAGARAAGPRIPKGLVLDEVEPGANGLIALPVRLGGLDATPVRAVLPGLS
jgi:kynurenine formamidase